MKKPLYDNVLIKENPPEKKSFLYLPGQNPLDESSTGTIVDIGHGRKLKNGSIIPLSVKIGDVVVFKPKIGTQLNIDGEVLRLIRENEIYGVLND